MKIDQYSAHTPTGRSVRQAITEATNDWDKGLITDEEFLDRAAEWLQQAAVALENPVQ